MPLGTPVSNQGSCLRNAEWLLNCDDSQENRMMSIQRADGLQCRSWRFDAHESIFHILLPTERARNQLFFQQFYYLIGFTIVEFNVIADRFNAYLWFLQKPFAVTCIHVLFNTKVMKALLEPLLFNYSDIYFLHFGFEQQRWLLFFRGTKEDAIRICVSGESLNVTHTK